jgi:hypothetical protein
VSREQQLSEWRAAIDKDIPPQSIKLDKRLSFPSEGRTPQAAFMKTPTRVCLDRFGNSYVLDSPSSCIFKFNAQGDFVKQLGRGGQGPGEFSFPSLFLVSDNTIIVDDVRNGRLQYLDLEGNYLRSFKTFEGYYSLSISNAGHLIAAPRRSPFNNSPLVKILSEDGILLFSFGNHPVGLGDSTSFDSVAIDVNTNGEVFVAFRLLALVQRYSASGRLVREYKINHSFMEKREKYNLTLRGSTKAARDKRYYVVIESLKATEEGFYILINNSPCLEILEFDDLGNQKRSFFWDEDWSYYARDFAVRNANGEELFYVVQISPDYCIDVLGPR